MSEKKEMNNEDTKKVEETGNDDKVIETESTGKKVLKIGLKVLAGVATLVAGIFIGRVTNEHDDDSDEDSDNSGTEE